MEDTGGAETVQSFAKSECVCGYRDQRFKNYAWEPKRVIFDEEVFGKVIFSRYFDVSVWEDEEG